MEKHDTFNSFQYQDLLLREADVYASAKYEYMVNSLKLTPSSRILNVGCGSGELSFLLAERGFTVVGIDPVLEYIELAKKNTPPHLRGRCHFQVCSVESMGENEVFEAIVSADVLEHIQDDVDAVRLLTRILRPGGLMVLSVPALPVLFGYHDEILGHFRRYTARSFRKMLQFTPELTVITQKYFGFFFILPAYLYSRLLRKQYPSQAYSPAKATAALWSLSTIVRFALSVERIMRFPLGTSLITVCKKVK